MSAPQAPTASNGENESIIQLLEHFKDDDGRVALLVKELQELSNRVQVAELATVDPRLTTGGRRGSGTDGGGAPFRRGGSPDGERLRGADAFADAVHRVKRSIYNPPKPAQQSRPSGGGSGDGAGAGRGQSAAGAGRVEEAVLPDIPEDPTQPLPLPPGGHEWEALQAAVNDSVAAFGAAAAKMGWKKWALTRAHSALLVSLFWWAVAAAFRSDHPLSRPIQDYAFGHFCRHYVTVVLHLRGKARDQYQQVWIEMMAAAALYLLAEVFPRSQHKFDDALRALVMKQLRLWTAGALPADMHPSAHADAHDASPAAFSVATTAAAAAAAAAATAPPTGAASHGGGAQPRMLALMRSPPALPPAASEAQLSGYSLSGKSTPHQRPSSTSRISPAGSTRNSASERGTLGSLSAGHLAHGYASGDEWGPDGGRGGYGRSAGGHGGPQAFVFTKNSPLMVQMLFSSGGAAAAEGSGGGAVVAAPPIVKGLMKHTVGGTLARLHRALDEPNDEELSYSRMAAAASASATDAVAAYEASRRAAAAEALAMRRGLVEARGAIEARQRAALAAGSGQLKQMSDRLSGYIQNDVDRLMAGKPTRTEPASSGDAPRYLQPAAGQRSGGATGEGPSIKPARLMAPLYEMRRVEGNIRAALAGGRHSSTDTVARVTAVTVAREAAAAADWRPLAQWPVGTKDTRRKRLAAHVLYGLDLEQYAL